MRRELRIHCDAKCDSAGVRIRQHGAARNDRTRGHHSGYRGFFRNCASYQNWPNGGDRIRTCDLEVMSLASYRAAPPRVNFWVKQYHTLAVAEKEGLAQILGAFGIACTAKHRE